MNQFIELYEKIMAEAKMKFMIQYNKYNPSSKNEKRIQKTEMVVAKDEKTAIADFKKKYAKDKTVDFVEIYPMNEEDEENSCD